MRKIWLLALIAALFVATPSAHAQDETRVGIGLGMTNIGLDLFEFAVLTPASIYIPIDFGSFRLEPEIGFARFQEKFGDFEETSTVFQIGTGIFALRRMGSTTIYYGGRVGLVRFSLSEEGPGDDDSESSSTNVFLGPSMGAEHNFSDHFSLGGEVQVLYTSIGSEDEDDDSSASFLRTRPVFFVRWYP